MFTVTNLVKTLIVALLVGLSYGFYEAGTAFQQQVGFNPDQDMSKLEAFKAASEMMEPRYFWPHLIKQWVHYCAIIFVGCALLLAIATPPNKARKNASGSDAQTTRARF